MHLNKLECCGKVYLYDSLSGLGLVSLLASQAHQHMVI